MKATTKKLHSLVQAERKITYEILETILDAEDERLPEEEGYNSTFGWLVGKFNYSEGAAGRRATAARMIFYIPEIREALQNGDLNLTILSQVNTVARKAKLPYSQQNEFLQKLMGKTSREAEKILAAEFPQEFHRDSLRYLDAEHSRFSIVIDNETRNFLEKNRTLLSAKIPEGRWNDILKELAYVSAKDKTKGKKCEYRCEETGKECNSEFRVEDDHIIPRGKGGGDEKTNLRYLCKQHNLFMAEKVFGKKYMSKYRRRPAGEALRQWRERPPIK